MSSNIHTFDKTQNRNNTSNTNRTGLLGEGRTNPMSNIFSFPGMVNKRTKDPQNESFLFMLYSNFCPLLSFCSFTVIISIILTSLFIFQICIDGLTQTEAKQFLEINNSGLMTGMFANSYPDFKRK
jgi:hypothetical protein